MRRALHDQCLATYGVYHAKRSGRSIHSFSWTYLVTSLFGHEPEIGSGGLTFRVQRARRKAHARVRVSIPPRAHSVCWTSSKLNAFRALRSRIIVES